MAVTRQTDEATICFNGHEFNNDNDDTVTVSNDNDDTVTETCNNDIGHMPMWIAPNPPRLTLSTSPQKRGPQTTGELFHNEKCWVKMKDIPSGKLTVCY